MTLDALRRHYASTYGVAAGYLPSRLDGVLEWQARVLDAVTDAAGALVPAADAPSVAALRALLDADPTLGAQVDAMIAEQAALNEGTPPVTTRDQMLAMMNYILARAPEFECDKSKRHFFPMSSLFVLMMYTETGWTVFRNGPFNDALRGVLDAWCCYLDSPASTSVLNTSPTGWLSPCAHEVMNLADFVIPDPSAPDGGFGCFNAYFHREIIESKRPLAGPGSGMIVVSPNDGTLFRTASDVQLDADIWAKDQPYALRMVLDDFDEEVPFHGATYRLRAADYAGGSVIQTFLSGADYHRWRSPVSGTIVAQRVVDGLMFSELPAEGFDSSAGTLSQGYQANVNTRGLTFIKADWGPLGTVCVIPIGITEISSVTLTKSVGDHVEKGEELGYFSYGGSTLCVVFQPNTLLAFSYPSAPPDPNNPPKVQARAQIATARPYLEP